MNGDGGTGYWNKCYGFIRRVIDDAWPQPEGGAWERTHLPAGREFRFRPGVREVPLPKMGAGSTAHTFLKMHRDTVCYDTFQYVLL